MDVKDEKKAAATERSASVAGQSKSNISPSKKPRGNMRVRFKAQDMILENLRSLQVSSDDVDLGTELYVQINRVKVLFGA